MAPIAAALMRSQSRLSSLSAAANFYSHISLFPSAKPTAGSTPSPPSPAAVRHYYNWRSPICHRAAVADRFERRFATAATQNSYEGILTPLANPGGGEFGKYYSLPALDDPRIDRLPYSIKILLESAIRNCDEFQVSGKDVEKIIDWENSAPKQVEIPFKPARVLLQDFTGVPAVVDLACMRDAMNKLEGDSNKINPLPMSMVLPGVVGFKLSGKLGNGVTATDLVLTVTQMLRRHGVVGKFVEFYGEGMSELPLADRATIANMSPEYGATMGFFPVDHVTLQYLKLTGRSDETVAMIESYLRANKMFVDHSQAQAERVYSSYLELNLEEVEPCISGPKRPHDRVPLKEMKEDWQSCLDNKSGFKGFAIPKESQKKVVDFTFNGEPAQIKHGDVVIAAITSCTNTSNPSVMLGAALVAKKACELGLEVKPWIKTSLAPGSGVVTKYLEKSGLQKYLNQLGFHIVGYGCTTCIGNSGDIDESVASAISQNDIVAAAVLSGNRNFEGRVHPHTRANYLASPPLVVAYALAGTENKFSFLQREMEKMHSELKVVLSELKVDIEKMRMEHNVDLHDLKVDIEKMRMEHNVDLHDLKAQVEAGKYDVLKYVIGGLISLSALSFTAMKVLH